MTVLMVEGSQVKKRLDSLLPCLTNPNEQAAGVGHRCLPCSFYGLEPQFWVLHAKSKISLALAVLCLRARW